MAEPISLAASIITFIELSASITQFLGEVKGAAKNIHRLSADIEIMESLLSLLEGLAQPRKTWLAAKSMTAGNKPLEQYRGLLVLLKKKLKPLLGNKAIAALLWPLKKGEIRDILDSVERQKVAFILALQNEQLVLSETILNDVGGIARQLRDTQGVPTQSEIHTNYSIQHCGNNIGPVNVIYGIDQSLSQKTFNF